MMHKKSQAGFIIVIILTVLLIGGAAYYYYVSDNTENAVVGEVYSSSRVVFAITDAATNMQSVSQVLVTVESIQTHNTIDGWVNITSSAKTFDLLELKAQNKLELIADANVKPNNYDQVRMQISKVIVVDDSGEHEAKLPSNKLKIKGGNIKSNKKVGMDANGNVDVGLNIPSSATVDIDASGVIKVKNVPREGITDNDQEKKCGNGVCEESEVDYITLSDYVTYCPQDCKKTTNTKTEGELGVTNGGY